MKGYNKLMELDKSIFDEFRKEFVKVNDSNVEFIAVLRKRDYIRVDLKINGRAEWLHVTPNSWY